MDPPDQEMVRASQYCPVFALGVVGGVILLAGIIFGAIFFLRRRARDEEEIKSMAVAAGTTNLFRGNSVQFSVHSVDDSLRSSASLRSNTRSDARLYPNSPLHSAASPVMPTYHPNNAAGVSPASFGPASSSSFGSSTATSPLAAYAKMQHQSLQTGGGGPGGSQLFAAYTPGRVQPQQQQYLRDAGIVPGGDYARRVVTASGAPAQRIAGWQQQSPSRAMSLKADTKALGGEKFFGFVPPPAASVSEQDIKSKLRMGGGGSGGGGGAQPMWHSGPSPSPSPGGEPARVVDVRFVHERGPVATWSHMTVMDWALARRVGDAVLTVFANNGFDGPTLVALRAESVGSGIGSQMADALRATFGVVDFDTRRRIVGAVAGLAMAESAVAEAATADAASAAAAAAAAPPMYRPSDS
ncbi:hypothetical protein DFJ73DRAFT_929514 [Zopfochytrium polystomum]|nr:hypothetical protein DFJ73DRAFT_929514 [Zopfochytrium polystomum]